MSAKRKKKVQPDVVQEIRRLKSDEHLNPDQIATKLNISVTTVNRYSDESPSATSLLLVGRKATVIAAQSANQMCDETFELAIAEVNRRFKAKSLFDFSQVELKHLVDTFLKLTTIQIMRSTLSTSKETQRAAELEGQKYLAAKLGLSFGSDGTVSIPAGSVGSDEEPTSNTDLN